MVRPKKNKARTASGRISRAKSNTDTSFSPAEIATLRALAKDDIADPLWRTMIGYLHLNEKLTIVQLAAAKHLFEQIEAYNDAIGIKDVQSASLERGIGAHEPEPGTEAGDKIAMAEKRAIRDYKASMAIVDNCKAKSYIFRLYNDLALTFEELIPTREALDALAIFYRLTNDAHT